MKKTDSEVERQVLRTLKRDAATACREICVESRDGVVTLSGTAPSYHERSTIHGAARRAPGVRGVVNKIEVNAARFFLSQKSWLVNAPAPPLATMITSGASVQTKLSRLSQSSKALTLWVNPKSALRAAASRSSSASK